MEEQLNKSQDSKAFFSTLVSAISSIDTPCLVLNVSLIEVAAGLSVSFLQLFAALIFQLGVSSLEGK
jgi:hypothetical protein